MTWFIIDADYVIALHYYALKGLKNGAGQGFFDCLTRLQTLWGDGPVVFCFDGGCSARRALFPEYKANRADDEDRRERANQAKLMRTEWLKHCGFRNILFEVGYEADDHVAAAVRALPAGVMAIIVSADNDLWQLINDDVFCYNPRSNKAITLESFQAEWHIPPSLWPYVKSMAGDGTDGIPGIAGIGPKTAVKYYMGGLSRKQLEKFTATENLEIVNRNIKLVRLPFEGTPTPELVDKVIPSEHWQAKVAELELTALSRDFRATKLRSA